MHALLFMELSEGDDSNRIGEIISVDVVKLLCGKAHNAQQLVIACTSRSKQTCSPNNTTINNALSSASSFFISQPNPSHVVERSPVIGMKWTLMNALSIQIQAISFIVVNIDRFCLA
jgi:hypothetical protein